MNNTSVKIILGTKPISNGKYRVYLRIIKNRKRKLISLGLSCNKKDFSNETFLKTHINHKKENESLLHLKSKAFKIIRDFQFQEINFTLGEFERKFRGIEETNKNTLLFDFFNDVIDDLLKSGKIGNAKAYKNTRDSLVKFRGKKTKLKEVTLTFLEKYEVHLREIGNTNGGIAFKMRELKALINKAIKRKILQKKDYPFEYYKISKLKSSTIKKALTIEEFKKIRDVDLSETPHLLEAKNYFLFSVYCRGMNFKDMSLLKWENISNGRIQYTRAKTNGKFNLSILDEAQSILDFYKNQNRETNYVFPILLKEDLTPIQIANRKHKVLSRYNKKLKEIARKVGIESNISSYSARHSFCTILKEIGTPIEKISEMMGHSDVSITIAYLKEFSNEDLDKENLKFSDL